MSKQEQRQGLPTYPYTLHTIVSLELDETDIKMRSQHESITVAENIPDETGLADLFVAAPDLLEACEDLLKQEHEQKHEYDLWYDTAKIRAAIAKARP